MRSRIAASKENILRRTNEGLLARIKAVDPQVRAIVPVTAEYALEQAKKADERNRRKANPAL